MSKFLYLTGGRQNVGTDSYETKRCNAALLLQVNVETKKVTKLIEYVTPIEYKAEVDASVVFKAGSIHGDKIYLCTTTEVLIYRLSDMELLHHISHPYFNDLHHVCPGNENTILVACTGLDAVFELSLDGSLVNEWSVLADDIWTRFSKDTDYRKILSTKPHYSHPNFLFSIENEIYCNRLMQRDAVCLSNSKLKSFNYEIQPGHDGLVRDDKVYFTTVNGNILIFDALGRKCIKKIDLNEIYNVTYALGWCRGIEVLDENRLIVGFSRLRPTKWKENVDWVRHHLPFKKSKPELATRIACINIPESVVEWTINLEENDFGEIFSIMSDAYT